MSTQQDSSIQATSRQDEEQHLQQTLEIVRNNLTHYGREVARMQEDIDEMLAHYHDNDVEVLTILNNTVTLHDHMKRALMRNEKAQNKPYFGRIIFHDESLDKEESLYIGKGGITKDSTHQAVIDWRAPVANAYYENGLGQCTYRVPGGAEAAIDLKLKRTYEIEEGKLLDYFDSEVIANDDLLTKYLAKNKQAVLSEIVATIQKEQNDIIRKSPYHNIIVQGVAGSGKTTVAMHRISYILYNYAEKFRPDDFYIVGSNRILLNYITGVLPDLDVYGVRQMTMEQLFIRLLYEDWDADKYTVKSADNHIKGSALWFKSLEKYCDRLEQDTISCKTVFLNPKQFVEGLQDGKLGVFDTTKGQNNPKDLICLLDRETVERYLRQNTTVSIQSKINMLNERLRNKIKEEFLGKGIKYTEKERKAILKAYRRHYGGRVWKQSIYELYQDFLRKQNDAGADVTVPDTSFDVYDLASLAYLYKRVKETEVISEAHHIVIDEAQDFGMMAYLSLNFCIRGCTYTVMGDVSQNIHFGYGLNDWEDLRKLLLSDPADTFGLLKKSYRNTVEISDFATHILQHGRFFIYPVEPILRHGSPVQTQKLPNRNSLIRQTAAICQGWLKKGWDTIAVICRSMPGAAQAAKELSKYLDGIECDPAKAVFESGVMVLPVEYTKGLEFDAVLILNPTREEYPVEDGHAKLLYVAATRALHELCILHTGELTGLITDPVPEEYLKAYNREVVDVNTSFSAANTARKPFVYTAGAAGKPSADDTDSAGRLSADNADITGRPFAGNSDIVNQSSIQSNSVISASSNRKGNTSSALQAKPEKPIRKKISIVRNQLSETSKTTTPVTDMSVKKNSAIRNQNTNTADNHQNIVSPKLSGNAKTILCEFGDMPATEKLRPVGHGKIDLSVRWVVKQPDGLYLHSRYGILRLSPIGSAIVRITFARGTQVADHIHAGIAVRRTERTWMYKESGNTVDFMTDELFLQVDKNSGAIRYMTRDKKLLLAERSKDCRQLEPAPNGRTKVWLFPDWQKDEAIYAMGAGETQGMNIRKTARYISHANASETLPLLLSDKGYGILWAAEGPVMSCDLAAYGSYLCAESEVQMDYYFIAGKKSGTILNAYAYLCGKL